MRTLLLSFSAAVLAAASLFGQAKGKQSAPACGRACLEAFVDRYLDAMIAHDPAQAPFARGARFTENGQRLELGDGLWNTMTGKGAYRLFVTDVEAQQVAFLGSIQEMGAGAMIGLRLRIRNNQITEAEHFVVRSPSAAAGFERIGYKWDTPVAPAERMSRQDLVRVANSYFTGMQKNDGKGEYLFTDGCNRIENGSLTTNQPTPPGQQRPDPKTATSYSGQWSCLEQFKSGLIHFVTRIRDRRYVAVDPERGLVFAFAFFDHSAGDTRNFETPDGRKISAGPQQPWTWQIVELFQIKKGKIHQIEAILERSPYGMNSGWSSWEDGLSDRARDVAKQ
jgi:hypothetical protein